MKYKTLAIADSEQLIKEAQPMILDCRDLKDYRAGHLEEALHVHEGLKEALVKRGDKQRSLPKSTVKPRRSGRGCKVCF